MPVEDGLNDFSPSSRPHSAQKVCESTKSRSGLKDGARGNSRAPPARTRRISPAADSKVLASTSPADTVTGTDNNHPARSSALQRRCKHATQDRLQEIETVTPSSAVAAAAVRTVPDVEASILLLVAAAATRVCPDVTASVCLLYQVCGVSFTLGASGLVRNSVVRDIRFFA